MEELYATFKQLSSFSRRYQGFTLEKMITSMNSSAKLEQKSHVAIGILEAFITVVDCDVLDLGDFAAIYPGEPDFALRVLRKFTAYKASNISDFSLSDLTETDPPAIQWELQRPMWTEIAKLVNLSKIMITSHYFLLNDLLDMCKNLPKLKDIHVVIHPADPSHVKSPDFASRCVKSFGQVEKFEFFIYKVAENLDSIQPFQEGLINCLIINLPNIYHVECFDYYCNMSHACRELKGTSKLQILEFNAAELKADASILKKFPAVEYLTVDHRDSGTDTSETRAGIKLLTIFTKLKSLTLRNLLHVENNLVLYLDTCGRNLREFSFDYFLKNKVVLDLELIRRGCPQLTKLAIWFADVDDSKTLAGFTSLLQLVIDFNTGCKRNIRLLNLLSAPNLTNVRFCHFKVTVEEMTSTIDAIKSGTILAKNKCIYLELDRHSPKDLQPKMIAFIDAVKGVNKKNEPVVMFTTSISHF